jgi:hypothetical protein
MIFRCRNKICSLHKKIHDDDAQRTALSCRAILLVLDTAIQQALYRSTITTKDAYNKE